MIEIRKAIYHYLKALYPKVYFQQAPNTAKFPYIVYDFQMYPDGENETTVTLDIDGWDNKKDTTELENMMRSINSINKHVITTDAISVVFYLENKLPLTDDDESIKRRKYSYIGYLHELE